VTEIKFTVPGKPVAKGRPRFRVVSPKAGSIGKNGKPKKAFVHTYTPQKTESEEGAIRHIAALAMRDAGCAPLCGPLVIQMCAYVPIPTSWSQKKQTDAKEGRIYPTSKPDWDNYAKMQDACNLICWGDDAQIVDAHVYKRYSDTPRLVVCIKTKE
jgi:Holliday junction resolvase RusA-like endonuclease